MNNMMSCADPDKPRFVNTNFSYVGDKVPDLRRSAVGALVYRRGGFRWIFVGAPAALTCAFVMLLAMRWKIRVADCQ
ncbi:hypothetical protein BBOH_0344 [Bifidobacterium bohemicum DSM 22767]|uniref:Uncharacterized protein n=1 Tax=Bifidobacterium bohemicum DSM 22767 TaxID=1437606 RepID=A0A086ZK20_9BIFI|nr:hypothetical protein [Bifidobacterium bohemicum]KFI46870.1 hypothetical protein BBOH_0344 [Bifidobacterium bohemicum DSM 22767]